MFPSSDTRQCTSDLKRGPIQKFIRHLPEKFIVNCMGLRAAESPNRAKAAPWVYDASQSKAGRTVYNWLPIHALSLKNVLQWHWDNGVALHPVYVESYHRDGTKGGWLRRFSCRVCIFSTDADIHAINANDREAFDAVAQLEMRIDFTMKKPVPNHQHATYSEANQQPIRQRGRRTLAAMLVLKRRVTAMTQHQMVNIGIGNMPDAPLKYVAELWFPDQNLICTRKAKLFATSEEHAETIIHSTYPKATIESLRIL